MSVKFTINFEMFLILSDIYSVRLIIINKNDTIWRRDTALSGITLVSAKPYVEEYINPESRVRFYLKRM